MFNQTTPTETTHEPATTELLQIVARPSQETDEFGHPRTIEINHDQNGPCTLHLDFSGSAKALYASGFGDGSLWFYWDGDHLIPIEGELDYGDMVNECQTQG